MITDLRAALFCKNVKQQLDGQIDILGIRPDTWTYNQKPAIETLDLFLAVGFDGQGATGFVRMDAPQFTHRVPFATPAGVTSSGMFFTLMIPIVQPGQFVVTVVDHSKRAKPLKAKWTFKFEATAQDLGPEKAAEVVRVCNDETAKLLATLHGRAAERH